MTSKVGKKELTSLSVIYSLMPILTAFAGICANLMAGGVVINCVICFVLALLMLKSTKLYFSLWGNVSITDAIKETAGKTLSAVFAIIFFLLFSVSCVCEICLSVTQISDLTLKVLPEQNIRIAISVSSVILSLFGIEALTRHSYVVLFLGYLLMGILVYASFRGWNTDNIFPVLGVSVKETFTNYICIGIFSSVAPVLFMCNNLKSGNDSYKCARKTLIVSFIIMLLILIIYTLTVPYPMGKPYSHSLEAIFSSGSSGDVLHRFEVFLISLFTVFSVISVSYSIIICAKILKSLFGFKDVRPVIMLIGVIYANLSGLDWSVREYFFSRIFLAMLAFLTPLIFYICKKFSGEEKKI